MSTESARRNVSIPPRVKELAAERLQDTVTVACGPFNFFVDPDVYFHARSVGMQVFLSQARFPGKDVLDMGCGTGSVGIFALHRGARSATFTDVSPKAIKNTKKNLAAHELEERAEVLQSDLFSALGSKTFDVIMFNLPYSYAEGSQDEVADALGAPWAVARNYLDPGYTLIDKFMGGFARHLRPGGFAQVSFGTTGNVPLWNQLIAKHGLRLETVVAAPGVEPTDKNTWYVYRLHPPARSRPAAKSARPAPTRSSSNAKPKPRASAKPPARRAPRAAGRSSRAGR